MLSVYYNLQKEVLKFLLIENKVESYEGAKALYKKIEDNYESLLFALDMEIEGDFIMEYFEWGEKL